MKSILMTEGSCFSTRRWFTAALLLPWALYKSFKTGVPVGWSWFVGPSWSSATLDPWTKKTVFVGRSRLRRTVWMRVEPGKLKWRDSPIWDDFIDWCYEVEKEIPIETYKGVYTAGVNSHTQEIITRRKPGCECITCMHLVKQEMAQVVVN